MLLGKPRQGSTHCRAPGKRSTWRRGHHTAGRLASAQPGGGVTTLPGAWQALNLEAGSPPAGRLASAQPGGGVTTLPGAWQALNLEAGSPRTEAWP
ncbi:hypothetical protein CYMTET_26533 [Cymbomonas tetramitiformis]|uniref:Uncharacterized protein n=1 Tax=Cymbomonas tetramitiformis TaxID=36881 RepID=A0AAE0KXY4_9CHLO|nr:hypothetical protein CYMTET_26533 [Cymbomonas tetramitiformis]